MNLIGKLRKLFSFADMKMITSAANLAAFGNTFIREAIANDIIIAPGYKTIRNMGMGFWMIDNTWCTTEVKDQFLDYLKKRERTSTLATNQTNGGLRLFRRTL